MLSGVGRYRRLHAGLVRPPAALSSAVHQWTNAMCRGLALSDNRSCLRRPVRTPVPDAAQADKVVGLCAQIEASAASIKALAAARAAEASTWQAEGYRSAADQLAPHAGMSPSAAKRALETGRRLADQPDVAAAALAGELSAEQAAAVADGVAADPTQAAQLIDTSQTQLPSRTQRRSGQDQSRRHRPRSPPARSTPNAVPAPLDRPRRRLPSPPLRPPRRRRQPVAHARPHPPPPQHPTPTNPTGPADRNPRRPRLRRPHDHGRHRRRQNAELALADLIDLGLFPQLDTTTLAPRHPNPPPAPDPPARPALPAPDPRAPAPPAPAPPAPRRQPRLFPPSTTTSPHQASPHPGRPRPRPSRLTQAPAARNWPAAPPGS